MKIRCCRGQTGLEFIAGFLLIIMLFSVVVMLSIEKLSEAAHIKSLLDAKRIATSVKDNVNMVAQQGIGYYRYFSLPTQIEGGYDYEVVVRNNVVEIIWDDNTWTAPILGDNVSCHCLDRGLTRLNRVYSGPQGLEITCHRPNLVLEVEKSKPYYNRTVFVVKNDAHVPAGFFSIHFLTNASLDSIPVNSLGAGVEQTFEFNHSVTDLIEIQVDNYNIINESIESDNNHTWYPIWT